jgi:hypothetical protein
MYFGDVLGYSIKENFIQFYAAPQAAINGASEDCLICSGAMLFSVFGVNSAMAAEE